MIDLNKDEPKKPLDMTTEEAINFLFPKEVVETLNNAANPESKTLKSNDDKDLDCNDESYV